MSNYNVVMRQYQHSATLNGLVEKSDSCWVNELVVALHRVQQPDAEGAV